MGTANITFGQVGLGGSAGTLPPILDIFYAENITTNETTSVSSSNSAPNTGNRFQNSVRVILSEDGYVAIDADATKTIHPLVKANMETFFAVPAGATVSVIDSA